MNKETVSEEQVLFNKLKYDDKVLIINIMKTLQPEEKKIPEKLHHCYIDTDNKDIEFLIKNINDFVDRYNELLDYLKSKGE